MKKGLLLAVAFCVAAIVCADCRAEWWNSSWKYRRKATVEPPAANVGLPGREVGYAEFRTGGASKADASDVVVIGRGKQMPSKS